MEGPPTQVRNVIAEREIPYRPRFTKLTDRVTASILLQQMIYYWKVCGYRPFYKFRAPCKHDRYVEGDSWVECLGFSPAEFDTALKTIGTKITKGDSRIEALQGTDTCNLVLYWTDSNRVTWYELNTRLLDQLLNDLYSEEANSRKCNYLEDAKSESSIQLQKVQLHASQIPQNTHKVTAPKKPAREPDAVKEDPEYVDEPFEDDSPLSKKRYKWETPETKEQKEFLDVCGAKWFESKQKSRVKALLKAFEAGVIAGDDSYQRCLDYIEDKQELVEVPPLLPPSWYTYREAQAREHHWNRWGFIKALLDRDKLAQHCQLKQRELDRIPESARYVSVEEAERRAQEPVTAVITEDMIRQMEEATGLKYVEG